MIRKPIIRDSRARNFHFGDDAVAGIRLKSPRRSHTIGPDSPTGLEGSHCPKLARIQFRFTLIY
jgi:hypothetical protein